MHLCLLQSFINFLSLVCGFKLRGGSEIQIDQLEKALVCALQSRHSNLQPSLLFLIIPFCLIHYSLYPSIISPIHISHCTYAVCQTFHPVRQSFLLTITHSCCRFSTLCW